MNQIKEILGIQTVPVQMDILKRDKNVYPVNCLVLDVHPKLSVLDILMTEIDIIVMADILEGILLTHIIGNVKYLLFFF